MSRKYPDRNLYIYAWTQLVENLNKIFLHKISSFMQPENNTNVPRNSRDFHIGQAEIRTEKVLNLM